ncbi:MAG: cysteine synthase A, partial [Armatimonadetes bacterium]|nr:cysteine synthase A [Candidatus Hippobium faecium]
MNICSDITLAVGKTPLVKINKIIQNANVFVKPEGGNPAGSVKDRVGVYIVENAIKEGRLKKGMEIIEATSGNTGIGLCMVGAAKNIKVNIIMPDNMSVERIKIMKFLGGNVILTEGKLGMKGSIDKMNEMVNADSDRYFVADQFNNSDNPKIHELTTGPEIWEDTDGKVDVVVAGSGTGGTICGVAKYLKSKNPNIVIVACEPFENSAISKAKGLDVELHPHGIQGIGGGFIPKVTDPDLFDIVERVRTKDAIAFAKRLAKEEGIMAGISSGCALCGAYQICQREEMKGKNIVV